MKEIHLIFTGPMVSALLADHKTQTRRLTGQLLRPGDRIWVKETWGLATGAHEDPACAVRYQSDGSIESYTVPGVAKTYGAMCSTSDRWRPSTHMPRWASRIVLEVVESSRLEHLQDITEEDAQAEGLPRNWDDSPGWVGENHGWLTPAGVRHIERNTGKDCDESGYVRGGLSHVFEARECFRLWWDAFHKPGGRWSDNPLVYVHTFRRVTP